MRELGGPGPRLEGPRLRLGNAEFGVRLWASPAPGKGHDACRVGPNFAGIADGATPLRGGPQQGDAARRLAQNSLVALEALHRARPPERFKRAMERSTGGGPSEPLSAPCCTTVTLGSRGIFLEVALLGDTHAVVLQDGVCIHVHDDRLAPWEKARYRRIAQLVQGGASLKEANAAVLPLLQWQRQEKMNRDGGYWVFGPDPRASEHVITALFPAARVDAVLICSDGFARLINTFHHESPESLIHGITARGLEHYGKLLRHLESAPGSIQRHPRADVHDDATAIFLQRQGGRPPSSS